MKQPNNRIAAIILAAGFGTRLKEIGKKPLLPCLGKTFLELVFDKVKGIKLEPVIVVTNEIFCSDLKKLKLPTKTVINKSPEMGMFSSILIGLEEIKKKCDGFFLCPVDYPLVKFSTYQILLSAFVDQKNHIIKPQFNKQSGHPVLFPQNLFDELKKAPMEQGARNVTRKFIHQTCFVDVDDPGILININTPQLYQKYCQ